MKSETAGMSVAGGAETRTFDQMSNAVPPASYLIVIDNLSSRRIDVPNDGVLQIGRSTEADIQIDSEAVSRNHAKMIFARGDARIVDQASHNGTLVNGERIEGCYPLASGDVITIADTLLILRSDASRPDAPLDIDQMSRRIDQEIARATDYDRPFSLVIIRVEGAEARDRFRAAAASVRPMDVICVQGNTFVTLMPELGAQAGLEQGTSLLAGISVASARGGIATYPADGADTSTLLTAARSSLAVATAGQLVSASRAAVEHHVGTNSVIVADAAMVKLYDLIRRLARSDISALITGETGSGKENAAGALHHWSARSGGPFVTQNCAALPDSLAESELFGYERGAFSDAKVAKSGLLERANGGTLFLDEVGDLSLAVQAKLLRALEVKKITRLGDTREREIDVRIVAATNIDLDAAVSRGAFRRDLMFRLSAAIVSIPPLRHRRQEIPLLARMFVQVEAERLKRGGIEIAESVFAALARYEFPGNVRELKNAMDYAVATAEGPTIQTYDLPHRITGLRNDPAAAVPKTGLRPIADEIRELECRLIVEALDACDGVQTRAAAAIGMPLRTFTFRMKQYGIDSRDRKR